MSGIYDHDSQPSAVFAGVANTPPRKFIHSMTKYEDKENQIPGEDKDFLNHENPESIALQNEFY